MRGARRIRAGFSNTAWDLAFREVRAEIRGGQYGPVRAELRVNALLDDGDDEGVLSAPQPPNVIALCDARLDLTRHLVALIDQRHRVWRKYPVLLSLAKSSGWDSEALSEAYLRHLRQDLQAASAPRTGSKRQTGGLVALRVVEGRSEGP